MIAQRDLVYAFNKKADNNGRFIGYELGEIQSDFNFGLVIDGTKDSAQVQVWSTKEYELEPFTIIFHPNTNSWWIVSRDKTQRYFGENGFVYIHNLELLGAIELLNARDLTDCGFNDNTYTIKQFILRLLSLSTFEYDYSHNDFFSKDNETFLNRNVDFIKTFENYTLLSALREFLNGYNMVGKLEFILEKDGDVLFIQKAHLNIISLTGDYSLPTHNIDDFDNVKEIRTISKESFGTIVISNSQNVVASQSKIYPSSGSVRASGTEFKIQPHNAVVRLPSKVYKGISFTILRHSCVMYAFSHASGGAEQYYGNALDPFSATSLENYFDDFKEEVRTNSTASEYSQFLNDFENNKNEIIRKLQLGATIKLFDGNQVDPTANNGNGAIVKGQDVPYLVSLYSTYDTNNWHDRNFVFCSKDELNTLPNKVEGVAWERGSDLITNLEMFNSSTYRSPRTMNELMQEYGWTEPQNIEIWIYRWGNYGIAFARGSSLIPNYAQNQLTLANCSFIVEYIPMRDLKIKVDNINNGRDIQLYNQSGKQVDAGGLSKLINSYAKQISSDNIVKYKNYYNFNDVPNVGSIAYKGLVPYVINSISLDFSQNEATTDATKPYYITCEINMSKYFSTKSLLVNANTNIRDYEIPQKYNVKRIQVYKDYYEINYTSDSESTADSYLYGDDIFKFNRYPNQSKNYTALIKITLDETIGGNASENIPPSNTWYYQIDSTNYFLDKMFYIVADFVDNNIIGYGSQNVFSGFVLSRILSGLTDVLNTPISYVDGKGRVKGIEICLLYREQLLEAYRRYLDEKEEKYNNLENYSIFIPKEIYDYGKELAETVINESSYEKDATEVPVFEVGVQVADSDDVLIGDSILNQRKDCVYFYNFVIGENLTQDNVVNNVHLSNTNDYYYISNVAKINTQGSKNIIINFYGTETYNANSGAWTLDSAIVETIANKDVAIFRTSFNTITKEINEELLFIAKKVPTSATIGGNEQLGTASGFKLVLNHYKV